MWVERRVESCERIGLEVVVSVVVSGEAMSFDNEVRGVVCFVSFSLIPTVVSTLQVIHAMGWLRVM